MTKQEISAICDQLRKAPDLIVPLIRTIPEERLKERPSSGKWSVHEHACHLAEVHPLMEKRLGLMLREDHPTIPSYEPGRDFDEDHLLKKDLDSSIDQFIHDRASLVKRLESLSKEEWARTAEHDQYVEYSVFIMFRHLAMHDMLHAYRIEELLLER